MLKMIPNPWDSAKEYAPGDLVYYFGDIYQQVKMVEDPDNPGEMIPADIPYNSEGNDIPVFSPDWEYQRTVRVEDYYSLQNAVMSFLNSTDDDVRDMVPMFIQMAEESIDKTLKSPAQVVTAILKTDSCGRIPIPRQIKEVVHMRSAAETGPAFSLRERASITIERAVDKQEYERILQYYDRNAYFSAGQIEYPIYWEDSTHYWIAPILAEGTEVELSYTTHVPNLGTLVGACDDYGRPINENRQTIEQWMELGNSEVTFEQGFFHCTQNLWTQSIPDCLLYGTLVSSEGFLDNANRLAVWQSTFDRKLLEANKLFEEYENSRQRSQTMQFGYLRNQFSYYY